MKKIIKRLLTGVLALATICTSLPASPVMAKERASTTGSVVLEKHTHSLPISLTTAIQSHSIRNCSSRTGGLIR